MPTFRTSQARSLYQKAQADVKAIEFRTRELIKREIENTRIEIRKLEEASKAARRKMRTDAKVQRDMNIEQNKRDKMAIKSKYIGQISLLNSQTDRPASELKAKIDETISRMENELDIHRSRIEQIRAQIRTNLDTMLINNELELNDRVFKLEADSQQRIDKLEQESGASIGQILGQAEAAAREVDENLSGLPGA